MWAGTRISCDHIVQVYSSRLIYAHVEQQARPTDEPRTNEIGPAIPQNNQADRTPSRGQFGRPFRASKRQKARFEEQRHIATQDSRPAKRTMSLVF
jgi:hypothetical protein